MVKRKCDPKMVKQVNALNTSEEHHQLFDFIQAKLDDYVQSDYSVVYFHYGYTKSNKERSYN